MKPIQVTKSLSIVYLSINQAYAVFWFNDLLAVKNTLTEAYEYIEYLEDN